jgi:hypothetical protein
MGGTCFEYHTYSNTMKEENNIYSLRKGHKIAVHFGQQDNELHNRTHSKLSDADEVLYLLSNDIWAPVGNY